jgi:hypothetical protein
MQLKKPGLAAFQGTALVSTRSFPVALQARSVSAKCYVGMRRKK